LYPLENAALSRRTPTTDIDSSWNAIAFAAANPSASCELIRAEKRSGTTTEGRSELQIVLDFLRHGDVLMANFNFPFRLSITLQPGDKILESDS
jgi:S-adenosylmethionine:tRNA-ribosyltransferase-isomerase (queuine synthetase)